MQVWVRKIVLACRQAVVRVLLDPQIRTFDPEPRGKLVQNVLWKSKLHLKSVWN